MTAWDKYLASVERIAITPTPSRSREDMPRANREGVEVFACCKHPQPVEREAGVFCFACGRMHGGGE